MSKCDERTGVAHIHTRVKGVDRDARVLQPLGQLHAVQHVGQLGLRVGLPLVVALLPVDVLPVDLTVLVGQAGDDDDAEAEGRYFNYIGDNIRLLFIN